MESRPVDGAYGYLRFSMNGVTSMPTIYEAVGGLDGLLRLASAWHTRVLGDEVSWPGLDGHLGTGTTPWEASDGHASTLHGGTQAQLRQVSRESDRSDARRVRKECVQKC